MRALECISEYAQVRTSFCALRVTARESSLRFDLVVILLAFSFS